MSASSSRAYLDSLPAFPSLSLPHFLSFYFCSFKKNYLFMYLTVLPAWMDGWMDGYHQDAWCPSTKVRRATAGCQLPYECWESNPAPKPEQQVRLTTEPTLQLLFYSSEGGSHTAQPGLKLTVQPRLASSARVLELQACASTLASFPPSCGRVGFVFPKSSPITRDSL